MTQTKTKRVIRAADGTEFVADCQPDETDAECLRKSHELQNLEVQEIALVASGANRRQFGVLKQETLHKSDDSEQPVEIDPALAAEVQDYLATSTDVVAERTRRDLGQRRTARELKAAEEAVNTEVWATYTEDAGTIEQHYAKELLNNEDAAKAYERYEAAKRRSEHKRGF